MLEELTELLAHLEQYECRWFDGELYVARIVETVEAEPKPQLELA